MGVKKYLVTWNMKDWCQNEKGDLNFVQEIIAIVDPNCDVPTDAAGTAVVSREYFTGDLVGRRLPSKPIRALITLYQNHPNPFESYTVIGFELPEATWTRMVIYDVTGRVVHEIKGDFVKGYNEVTITADQLPSAGVLYYQLETTDYVASKRMVLVRGE